MTPSLRSVVSLLPWRERRCQYVVDGCHRAYDARSIAARSSALGAWLVGYDFRGLSVFCGRGRLARAGAVRGSVIGLCTPAPTLTSMHIPPIHARRETARNKFFTTVAEDVIAPNGSDYTYHFIDTTWDAVLVVPVLDNGRLVIERIYRHPYRAWLYEFPAGGIDHGEDPCAAGIRELEEETGYRAARCRPLMTFEPVPGLSRMRLHVVLAEGLVQTGTRSHEAMELIEVIETTRAEAWALAKQTPTSGFLLNGLLMLDHERSG